MYSVTSINDLTSSLDNVDIRYQAETGVPEWSPRGADTWYPFSNSIEDVTETVGVLNPANYYKFNVGVKGKFLWVSYNIYGGISNTDERLNFEYIFHDSRNVNFHVATINIEELLQTQAAIQFPDYFNTYQFRVFKY